MVVLMLASRIAGVEEVGVEVGETVERVEIGETLSWREDTGVAETAGIREVLTVGVVPWRMVAASGSYNLDVDWAWTND